MRVKLLQKINSKSHKNLLCKFDDAKMGHFLYTF